VKTVAAIVNPTAGSPRVRLSAAAAASLLQRNGCEVEIFVTRASGEATELAARAAESHPVVAAVGGDGTVHEVARGLLGTDAALAVLPCGSGNDLAFALGIEGAAAGAAAAGRGRIRRIDVAYLADRPFFNSAGFFLSGLVSGRAHRLWRGVGKLRYTLAAAWSLLGYRPQRGRWQLDGVPQVLDRRWLLAEVCNGPSAGGNFLLCPDADPGDGILDFCLARPVSALTLLRLFPAAARGEPFAHPAVHRPRARGATITIEQPVPVHLDGEPSLLQAGSFRIRLAAGRLAVLSPRDRSLSAGARPRRRT